MTSHGATIGSEATPRPTLAGTIGDGALFLIPLAGYVVLDVGTRWMSRVDGFRLDDPVLLIGALASQPLAWGVGVAGASALILRSRERLLTKWGELDRGRLLRWLVVPGLALLTWQDVLYDYNFVVDQTHLVDRSLMAALGVAALARPVFLVPFALQSRIVAEQFTVPFNTRFAQNIDELLVISLLVIAAVHLAYVVTASSDSSPAIPLLGAAVAAHYFIPGRSKLVANWIAYDDLSNLPLAGYSAGWLGQTDGAFARTASGALRSLGGFALVGTMAVELGSVVAAFHHRILRLWLPAAILFHIILFALTGFWFLGWIAVEVALWFALSQRPVRDWLSAAWTPARGAATVIVVVALGAFAFHPPRLTWFDSPVSYGYRITATGVSGTEYNVPPSLFAPNEQEISFMQATLGPREPLASGYGAATTDPTAYRELQDLTTLDDVATAELATEPAITGDATEYLAQFARFANAGTRVPWSGVSPPDHFWTHGSEPVFRFDEPIVRIDVSVLTSLHRDGDPVTRLERVLSLAVDDDGSSRVIDDA